MTRQQRQQQTAALRARRKASGWTQALVAVRAGVHVSSIVRWERGQRVPHNGSLRRWVRALEVRR
jgi:transcriptional regulator with XRE-family HTH domain